MPAIVDTTPADGGEPISVFESGAILLVAEKTGFIPACRIVRVTEWLFGRWGSWSMAGQNHHFVRAEDPCD